MRYWPRRIQRGSRRRSARDGVALGVALSLLLLHGVSTQADSGSLVQRGKYVAEAADCGSCHTASGGRPFAGGTPLKTAFGTLYGTNITPDPQTGIGAWSQADFARALKQGVRKDGAYLYPAMPYGNYTKMSDGDIEALWAYLRSIPAVHAAVPKNTLPFPLSMRSTLAVWQGLYFKPGAFEPNSRESSAWNRGAYLVDALGHCDQCHTPRTVAQGLKTEHELTGAPIEGWYAPNISSDSLSSLKDWSRTDLVKFFKTGVMPGNSKAVGPMQEVVHDSLSRLTDADLNAMAEFLKSQPKPAAPLAASNTSWPRERLDAGRRLYEDHCSSCHQSNGKGMPGSVPALAGDDAVTAAEPNNVIMAELEGFPAQGTWGAMGSFAKTLSDDEIADVANYVRTAWGNQAPANAAPWQVANSRKYGQPSGSESHALLCPDLAPAIIQPALSAGPEALQQAASDRGKMAQLVSKYRSAVPKASNAEVIEALSAAYCRKLATEPLSEARMSADIADFAQRTATVLKPTG